MKAVTVKEINNELVNLSPREIRELCLRLARFKKENKELLTYILFESGDEESYIQSVKDDMDVQFGEINRKSNYFIRKGLRRILLSTRKFIRYSSRKQTEVDLLIYYCIKLKKFYPSLQNNTSLRKLYNKLVETIRIKVGAMNEDLQFDYGSQIESLGI